MQARAVELSALGPKALSFTSQTSSQQAAEDSGKPLSTRMSA